MKPVFLTKAQYYFLMEYQAEWMECWSKIQGIVWRYDWVSFYPNAEQMAFLETVWPFKDAGYRIVVDIPDFHTV